ncbi:hypothetical protein F5Y18DRAFT_383046 [Xylariaceae sp. FL1019]|nr:hypothetical protein F5Y18DRAFT_383046 [Xylariaceae sp. FL1019]
MHLQPPVQTQLSRWCYNNNTAPASIAPHNRYTLSRTHLFPSAPKHLLLLHTHHPSSTPPSPILYTTSLTICFGIYYTMASEHESTGVLGSLASSVKSMVTGHHAEVQTAHTSATVEENGAVEYPKLDTAETATTEVVERTEDVQEDTATIHKEQAAVVVHEDVKPHELEKVDTVVDKEIHQDHYHTTVVPVKDTKVLPTEHVYQDNEAEYDIDHRNNAAKKAAKKKAESIRNEKAVEETTHAKEVAPTKKEEHIHHHIHETIQPVIERETIREKIIHVTNHVHETEHLKDQFHHATVAPAISMADFENGLGAEKEVTIEEVTLVQDEDEEDGEEVAQDGKHGKEYKAPTTRSARSTKEVSVSATRKDHKGTPANPKKRHAPTDAETEDLEPVTKVGKLAS